MQDGNVLFEKGYGYADVKSKKAVDPNTTIFRLASISNLFTGISAMQLVASAPALDIEDEVHAGRACLPDLELGCSALAPDRPGPPDLEREEPCILTVTL
jgi:hypothetical protein